MKTSHLEVIFSVFHEQEKAAKCGEILGSHLATVANTLGDSEHIKWTTILPTETPFSHSSQVPLHTKHTILFLLLKKSPQFNNLNQYMKDHKIKQNVALPLHERMHVLGDICWWDGVQFPQYLFLYFNIMVQKQGVNKMEEAHHRTIHNFFSFLL